jgi:hypothetical protein
VPSEDELEAAILEEEEEAEGEEETHDLMQDKDDDRQHTMDNGNEPNTL